MYSEFQSLSPQKRGSVLWLTLNNPPLNGMTGDMHRDMSRIFRVINRDDDTRAVVLTGAGERGFCAGGDPNRMATSIDDDAWWCEAIKEGREIILSMLDCDTPIVARINGHAVGLGASLALASDITVMVEDAKIGDTHVKVGLVAGDGGSLIWPHLVGMSAAKRYLLTGDLMTGAEACAIGLVTFAVARDQLDPVVNDWAQRLANGASQAVYGTKRALNSLIRQQAQIFMDAHLGLETLSHLSTDHREAVAAYAAKRPPKFTGR